MMRKILFLSFILTSFFRFKSISKKFQSLIKRNDGNDASFRLKKEIAEVKRLFSSISNYNSDVAFFIDMRIPSSKNRLFIYNYNFDKVVEKIIDSSEKDIILDIYY